MSVILPATALTPLTGGLAAKASASSMGTSAESLSFSEVFVLSLKTAPVGTKAGAATVITQTVEAVVAKAPEEPQAEGSYPADLLGAMVMALQTLDRAMPTAPAITTAARSKSAPTDPEGLTATQGSHHPAPETATTAPPIVSAMAAGAPQPVHPADLTPAPVAAPDAAPTRPATDTTPMPGHTPAAPSIAHPLPEAAIVSNTQSHTAQAPQSSGQKAMTSALHVPAKDDTSTSTAIEPAKGVITAAPVADLPDTASTAAASPVMASVTAFNSVAERITQPVRPATLTPLTPQASVAIPVAAPIAASVVSPVAAPAQFAADPAPLSAHTPVAKQATRNPPVTTVASSTPSPTVQTPQSSRQNTVPSALPMPATGENTTNPVAEPAKGEITAAPVTDLPGAASLVAPSPVMAPITAVDRMVDGFTQPVRPAAFTPFIPQAPVAVPVVAASEVSPAASHAQAAADAAPLSAHTAAAQPTARTPPEAAVVGSTSRHIPQAPQSSGQNTLRASAKDAPPTSPAIELAKGTITAAPVTGLPDTASPAATRSPATASPVMTPVTTFNRVADGLTQPVRPAGLTPLTPQALVAAPIAASVPAPAAAPTRPAANTTSVSIQTPVAQSTARTLPETSLGSSTGNQTTEIPATASAVPTGPALATATVMNGMAETLIRTVSLMAQKQATPLQPAASPVRPALVNDAPAEALATDGSTAPLLPNLDTTSSTEAASSFILSSNSDNLGHGDTFDNTANNIVNTGFLPQPGPTAPNPAAAATGLANTHPTDANVVQALLSPEVSSKEWRHALSQQVVHLKQSDQQVAELQLNPPGLGPLKVTLAMVDQQMQLMFVSAHAAVRAAVEAAVPQLRASLADTGISLGNTTVSADNQPQAAFAQSQQNASQQRRAYRQASQSTPASFNPGPASGRSQPSHGRVDTFA